MASGLVDGMNIDEILTEKKPVDIPWESFTFER